VGVVQIRHAAVDDAPALARVMIAANVNTFTGLVPQRCLEWITHEESSANWARTLTPGTLRQEECLLVVEDGEGAVVGFALGKLLEDERFEEYRAELRSMAVDPKWQRRGIGKKLVRAVVEHLVGFGISSLIVRVLKANPNCGFYERLGAELIEEEEYDWNGVVLPMNVYGWRDMRGLLQQTMSTTERC
jgi:ribosomal protein S18 acetylase RimI-like enzyme